MDGGPLLEVELVHEDIGVQQVSDFDAHLHQLEQVVVEQVRVDVGVLVLDNVVDQDR